MTSDPDLLKALRASAGLPPREANSRMPEEMQIAVEADAPRTDAPASGEASVESALFPGRVDFWRKLAREADAVDGGALRVPADELLEFIARSDRLAAVEAELAAQVERAFREGHCAGWQSYEGAIDGGIAANDDWHGSRARAELNERERC